MIDFLKDKGNSKLQETLAEYAFLKDLLVDGARNSIKVLVSRSDFDAFGYDILVQREDNKRVFKLQLKATSGKARVWDIHKSLLEDENGNVVLIKVKSEMNDINFEYYSILSNSRDHIISRKPKIAHQKKCKLTMADLSKVGRDELINKILTTPNSAQAQVLKQ
jgi:hypothetical protein